jgi:PTS system glucitol/sorbitol-specific IIC component
MQFLSNLATGFIGLFQTGGETFLGYFFSIGDDGQISLGILPTLICLMTCVNAIIAIIGQDKVEKFGRLCGKNIITRYTIMPVIALFFFCNPMCYTLGRFLEEKYKPAFYDATVSFCHPITGLFPHANASEIFVYNGITAGLLTLGIKELGGIAIRYFIVGLIVILIRGIICERLTVRFMKKGEKANV